jgi:NADPH:quinone reductase-like Zn-dependent oxidoreductase
MPTNTMTAISQDVAGGPEVLRVVERPRPVPGPTEILVRVHAAGVNPTDWKTRARGYFYADEAPPFTLGFDVAGVVEAVGPGVTVFAPGDAVFGMPRFPRPAGAYAEYVTGPARHFAATPPGLDHVHAAALPLSGLTAWQALVDTAPVSAGQRVLVHAAAGGVGHLAVQIAKARGAHVIGTARAAKHEFLRDLGVDEPVDYTTTSVEEAVREVDVVLDTVGGDTTRRSLACLRPGGTLVTIIPPVGFDDDRLPRRADVTVRWMLVEPDPIGLREIAALVTSGDLRGHVERVLPLAEAAEAHRHGEKGRTTGKLVLAVRP